MQADRQAPEVAVKLGWGVFHLKDGAVHVAPCRDDRVVMAPHQLNPDCICEPRFAIAVEHYQNDIWVHSEAKP